MHQHKATRLHYIAASSGATEASNTGNPILNEAVAAVNMQVTCRCNQLVKCLKHAGQSDCSNRQIGTYSDIGAPSLM